jgi:GSH-dependent disulfide-bond oxidoreductase
MGADYSIADISLLGWVRNLIGFYEARELVGFDRFLHVQAWLDRGLDSTVIAVVESGRGCGFRER